MCQFNTHYTYIGRVITNELMKIDYSSVHIALVLLLSKRAFHLKSISSFRTYLTVTIVCIRKIKLFVLFRPVMCVCCQKDTKRNGTGKDNCAFLLITEGLVVISGTTYKSLEDGTDMLSRKVGKN